LNQKQLDRVMAKLGHPPVTLANLKACK
jgi:hypothetical protein